MSEATGSASSSPADVVPAGGAIPAAGALTPQEAETKVVEALREVYDPEIPVNIYDLGMIYHVEVSPDLKVAVRMTLTSPMCPVAGSLPGEVETRLREIPGVAGATVELVWDPPWDRDMMSEAARLTLGF